MLIQCEGRNQTQNTDQMTGLASFEANRLSKLVNWYRKIGLQKTNNNNKEDKLFNL